MLDRRIEEFRAIAEVVEELCGAAGVEVHPGIVDALIRRWIGLMARAWSEAGQPVLLGVPSELGRVIAQELIEGEWLLRAQRSTATFSTHP